MEDARAIKGYLDQVHEMVASLIFSADRNLSLRRQRLLISKGSLVFRAPLERDYLEGTTIRPMQDDEFLQIDPKDPSVLKKVWPYFFY